MDYLNAYLLRDATSRTPWGIHAPRFKTTTTYTPFLYTDIMLHQHTTTKLEEAQRVPH